MATQERNTRWREFALVLIVSGLPWKILDFLVQYASGQTVTQAQPYGIAYWTSSTMFLIVTLLTVGYVLKCQGRTLADLGLRAGDTVFGLILIVAIVLLLLNYGVPTPNPIESKVFYYFTMEHFQKQSEFQRQYSSFNVPNLVMTVAYQVSAVIATGLALAYLVTELKELKGPLWAILLGVIAMIVMSRPLTTSLVLALAGAITLAWGLSRRRLTPFFLLGLSPLAVQLMMEADNVRQALHR